MQFHKKITNVLKGHLIW